MMPPMILVTRLTVTAMMNDVGDAEMQMTMMFTKMFAINAEATKCEMTMMLISTTVCCLLQMLLTMMKVYHFKMNE